MNENRLADWLKEFEVSQAELVRKLAEAGYSITPAAISRWLSGHKYPSISSQIAIEQITGGAVRPSDWSDTRRHRILVAMEKGTVNAGRREDRKAEMLRKKREG